MFLPHGFALMANALDFNGAAAHTFSKPQGALDTFTALTKRFGPSLKITLTTLGDDTFRITASK